MLRLIPRVSGCVHEVAELFRMSFELKLCRGKVGEDTCGKCARIGRESAVLATRVYFSSANNSSWDLST